MNNAAKARDGLMTLGLFWSSPEREGERGKPLIKIFISLKDRWRRSGCEYATSVIKASVV
jgi:hypothetical protein